jgi:hypothetical protein
LLIGVPAAFRKQAVDIGQRAVAADEEPEAFAIRLAWWKLGRLLAKVERGTGPGRGKKALSVLTSLLAKIGLTKPVALEAERIGKMPATRFQSMSER